ncbi:hypothetical protein HZA97_01725 [Candidatus Woesearchaeota archaeon]|nr:hypothetical protein [Candidatus Woesearchaeota archaeon]
MEKFLTFLRNLSRKTYKELVLNVWYDSSLSTSTNILQQTSHRLNDDFDLFDGNIYFVIVN